jgi:transcriptional regulator with XRE-family HTH domain
VGQVTGTTDGGHPHPLGELIRQQRELAALPLRQLASLVGISNPYLSQIERGLRAPSEAVKERIAETLRIPPDAMSGEPGDTTAERQSPAGLLAAIATEEALTRGQRRALAEIYTAMAEVTARNRKRRSEPNTRSTNRRGNSRS